VRSFLSYLGKVEEGGKRRRGERHLSSLISLPSDGMRASYLYGVEVGWPRFLWGEKRGKGK